MAVRTRRFLMQVGHFSRAIATGNQAVTGVGFKPKAVILFQVTANNEVTWGNNQGPLVSMFTGTGAANCVALTTAVQNNVAPPVPMSTSLTEKAHRAYDHAGTIDAEADLVSLDADGFTLNWTTANAQANIIQYIAFGGDSLVAKIVKWGINAPNGQNYPQSITGAGFRPDLVFTLFSSPGFASYPFQATTGARFRMSAADKYGGQWCVNLAADTSGSGPVTARGLYRAIIHAETSSAVTCHAILTSMDRDGFTVNWTNQFTVALANGLASLCLGGIDARAGIVQAIAGSGVQTVDAPGFFPSGVLLAGIQSATLDSKLTQAEISIGAASYAGNKTSGAIAHIVRDQTNPSKASKYTDSGAFYLLADNATPVVDRKATIAGFHNLGWSMSWDVGGAQVQLGYVAFAPARSSAHRVELELNGPGIGWTDLGKDLLMDPDLSVEYGISGTGPADLVASTGRLRFTLNNSEANAAGILGYYSPQNTAVRAGFKLGIGVRYTFQIPAEQVVWASVVGASALDNTLTKTAADGWGTGGAASTKALVSGDGFIEVVADATNTQRAFGLSKGDTNQDYPDIDFAILMTAAATFQVYESGAAMTDAIAYAALDTLRVGVEAGRVRYRKNGLIVYESAKVPAYPLLVDTALYTNGSKITDAIVSGLLGDPSTGAFQGYTTLPRRVLYGKFVGRLRDIDPQPGKYRDRKTTCQAVDWINEAAQTKYTVATQVNKRTDEVLSTIIAVVPRQPTATQFDVADSTFPYALDNGLTENATVLTECQRLMQSEYGHLVVRGGLDVWGLLRFEKRTGRLTPAPQLAFNGTMQELNAESSSGKVRNRAKVTGHPRIVDAVTTTVLFAKPNQNNPSVAPGATLKISGRYTDPSNPNARVGGTDMQAPVATTDYLMNAAADGSGANLTANFTVVATYGANQVDYAITNGGGTLGYVTKLQARGRGLYDYAPIDAEVKDQSSIDTIGESLITIDMPYQSDLSVPYAVASFIIAAWAPLGATECAVRFVPRDDTELMIAMALEPGDPISLVEELTGVMGVYFIQGVSIVIDEDKVTLTWGLQRAVVQNYWQLGTAGFSELGLTTVLAPL